MNWRWIIRCGSEIKSELRENPKVWPTVLPDLLALIFWSVFELDQKVIGLDNFSTGHRRNLDEVSQGVWYQWSNFQLIDGDINNPKDREFVVVGVDYISHQVDWISVSSIENLVVSG